MQLEERLSSAPMGVAFSLTLASASASTLEVLIFMSMLRAAGGQAVQHTSRRFSPELFPLLLLLLSLYCPDVSSKGPRNRVDC